MSQSQSLLDLLPKNALSLDSFVCMPANDEILNHLRSVAHGSTGSTYIYGASGEGRSHLLQAVCLEAMQAGRAAYYLPLARVMHFDPKVLLHGLAEDGLLCLDDLQAIADNRDWNEALYHDYNLRHKHGGAIVASAYFPPARLAFCTEDLRSRLSLGPVYFLHPLDEAHQKILVQERAKSCGFNLGDAEWRYIICRARRNTGMLINLVEQIDKAALIQKRRLNSHLIKELASW